jgi:uncharacterized FlgJ-related protein
MEVVGIINTSMRAANNAAVITHDFLQSEEGRSIKKTIIQWIKRKIDKYIYHIRREKHFIVNNDIKNKHHSSP